MYSYHQLYTGSHLLADIGGYLGLFLGLSMFGLVELLEKVVGKLDNIDKVSSREQRKLNEEMAALESVPMTQV